jgi:hypothetical protein
MSEPFPTLDVDPFAVACKERRAWVRYTSERDTTCQPLAAGNGLSWEGKLLNVSRAGLGLLLNRRFEVGTLLTVEVLGSNGQPGGNMLARVSRPPVHQDGGWNVGCVLVNELSAEEVQAFAAAL